MNEKGESFGPIDFPEKLTIEQESHLVHDWDGHKGRAEGWIPGKGIHGSNIYLKIKITGE